MIWRLVAKMKVCGGMGASYMVLWRYFLIGIDVPLIIYRSLYLGFHLVFCIEIVSDFSDQTSWRLQNTKNVSVEV